MSYSRIHHARLRRTSSATTRDLHHVETDTKDFFKDLYVDAVITLTKIGIGLTLFKAQLLGAAVHELGHAVVDDAAAYSITAPAVAGTYV